MTTEESKVAYLEARRADISSRLQTLHAKPEDWNPDEWATVGGLLADVEQINAFRYLEIR